jgi:hypothetical protein
MLPWVAARRLLIILVLLLVVSVVAAALAPNRTGRLTSSESTTTSTTTIPPEPTGDEVSLRIDASPQKPETVEAFTGDQVALSVGIASGAGRSISIDDLGLTEFAAPEAPAHFDLLLRDAGRLLITDDRGQTVGRLDVQAPAKDHG